MLFKNAFTSCLCRCEQHNALKPSCKNFRYLCPILTKYGVSRQIFTKVPNLKLHGNPSSGSRVDSADGQTEIMKLKGPFRIMRKPLKRITFIPTYVRSYCIITKDLAQIQEVEVLLKIFLRFKEPLTSLEVLAKGPSPKPADSNLSPPIFSIQYTL